MANRTRDTANLVSANNLYVDIGTDRVGIGTTNPTSKLTVVGTSLITGISTIGNLIITPVGTGATVGGVGVVTYYGDGGNLTGIGVTDGDKGDITVSLAGTTWTIDSDAVTYAKIQNVTATDRLLGRSTAGAGDIEEIICTAAGRALLDDADAAAQRTTLDAAAVNATTFVGTTSIALNRTSAAQVLTGINGITFPATQVTSADANTLDDYEEGTFTPVLVGVTTSGTGTYSFQNGLYTKIGDTVMFFIFLAWSAHTGTGNMRINGLPFTTDSRIIDFGATIRPTNLTSPANTIITAELDNGNSIVRLFSQEIATSVVAGLAMDTSGQISITGVYKIS